MSHVDTCGSIAICMHGYTKYNGKRVYGVLCDSKMNVKINVKIRIVVGLRRADPIKCSLQVRFETPRGLVVGLQCFAEWVMLSGGNLRPTAGGQLYFHSMY